MARIKITEQHDECATIYWAELTDLFPMGCGCSPEAAMRSLQSCAKQLIGQVIQDAIDYYYATAAQEEVIKK